MVTNNFKGRMFGSVLAKKLKNQFTIIVYMTKMRMITTRIWKSS